MNLNNIRNILSRHRCIPPTIPLGILSSVLVVWAVLPFSDTPVIHPDSAIFMYGGGILAEGYSPYVYLFDIKPPLIFEVLGLLSATLPDDPLLYFRAATVLTAITFVILVLLTTQLTKTLTGSNLAGAVAGLATLTYSPLYLIVALGPWTKHFALTMGLLGLYLWIEKRPFVAGAASAAAAGFWPLAVLFPVVILLESVRESTVSETTSVVLGGITTTVLVLLPIVLLGGGYNMVYEVIFYQLSNPESFDPANTVTRMVRHLGISSLVVGIGVMGIVREVVTERSRWWLLAGVVFIIFQVFLLDFDSYPDLFLLLIWTSIGLGVGASQIDNRPVQVGLVCGIPVLLLFSIVSSQDALIGEMTQYVGNSYHKWTVYHAVMGHEYPSDKCMQWSRARIEWGRANGLRLPENCEPMDGVRGERF